MKSLLVVFAVVLACGYAAPPQVVKIVRQNSEVHADGSFNYGFESEDGINVQSQGQLKQLGQDTALEVQGSFQYTAPDGTPIAVQYIANENGFQPQGAHLPTPPPIPEAIARALEYIAAHPYVEQPASHK